MLASVLNSQRAIDASIIVVKAFIHLREFVMMSKDLSRKLEIYETKTHRKLEEHDQKFQIVFETLKKALIQESKPRNPMGFTVD